MLRQAGIRDVRGYTLKPSEYKGNFIQEVLAVPQFL